MNAVKTLSVPRRTLASIGVAVLFGAGVLLAASAGNAATDTTAAIQADTETAVTAAVDGAALSQALNALHTELAADRDALADTVTSRSSEAWREGMQAVANKRRTEMAAIRAEFGVDTPTNNEQHTTGEHQRGRPDHAGIPEHAHAKAHARANMNAHAPVGVTDLTDPTDD